MPTKEQVVARVGVRVWNTMCKTGFLDGIALTRNKDGTVEYPSDAIDRAYRAAKGDKHHTWDRGVVDE